MKYYEAHEGAYQKKLAAGQVAWDKDEKDYGDFFMRPLVERFLGETNISFPGATVLDLGCGTGGLACFLASRGFRVTGVDVAPSAIAKAKEKAEEQNLKIDFRVDDLCREKWPVHTFDLIIDNHFLHCIIKKEERSFILKHICQALKPEGEFWVETMVGHPKMVPFPIWNLDEQGIAWREVLQGEKKVAECVEREGKVWMPQRCIQPSSEILLAELEEAGLRVLWQETKPPSEKGATADFQARCKAKF